ncbi:MAG: SDR family oxidoreductase [Acidobacteria bacterium]|nr:SDR family oxidoreductase [Acidobacteriota bacterium]
MPSFLESLFSLTGQTAMVTGCRRGIGKAITLALARAGADIIGISHTLQPGSDIEGEVRELGRNFQGYACDFADRTAVYDLLHELQRRSAPIDILVNNAGAILRKAAVEHPDEYWDQILEVNLNSAFVLTRELGGQMVLRGAGKVIFIASLLTFQGGITVPSYAASKGGIGQLTKALANEWAPRGVNVNAIAPGYVETDNTTALRADPMRNPGILARIPAGRWGVPGDLAGAALFLASKASDYVHGTILVVDGGWLAR